MKILGFTLRPAPGTTLPAWPRQGRSCLFGTRVGLEQMGPQIPGTQDSGPFQCSPRESLTQVILGDTFLCGYQEKSRNERRSWKRAQTLTHPQQYHDQDPTRALVSQGGTEKRYRTQGDPGGYRGNTSKGTGGALNSLLCWGTTMYSTGSLLLFMNFLNSCRACGFSSGLLAVGEGPGSRGGDPAQLCRELMTLRTEPPPSTRGFTLRMDEVALFMPETPGSRARRQQEAGVPVSMVSV